jgi:hypothetical protein
VLIGTAVVGATTLIFSIIMVLRNSIAEANLDMTLAQAMVAVSA